MSEEDIDISESAKTAAYITIAVVTPLIFFYVGSAKGMLPFDFSLPLTTPLAILSTVVIFNITFSISVLDQWRQ